MKNRTAIVLSLALIFLSSVPGICRAQPAPEDEFIIGLIPEENIFRQIKNHRPLAAYLSEKLGIKVKFTILSRYGDVVDRFVSSGMDGAFFDIFTAAIAHEKLGVVPVAKPMSADGSASVRGYLFVRKDGGIKSIADTRGKRAAFVDRATATGFVFALALLRERGVNDIDDFFGEYYFTGSNDSAVYAVLDGKAEVGAAKSRILDRLSIKDPLIKDEILIIARSEELPDTTLCLRKDIPEEMKRKLGETLAAMDADPMGREALKALGAMKFIEATSDDFGPVIELSKRAGIDLRSYRYR
jgi:phosphonate transport system substrate-binding protein